jgi:hypothetical protein
MIARTVKIKSFHFSYQALFDPASTGREAKVEEKGR